MARDASHAWSSPPRSASPWRFALRLLAPHPWRTALVLFLLIATALCGLAAPSIVQYVVDNGVLARNERAVLVGSAALFGVALLRLWIGWTQGQSYIALSSLVLIRLRARFLEQVQRMPWPEHSSATFGEFTTRFQRDLSVLQEFATAALPALVTNVLTLAGVIAFGLWYAPQLFVLSLVPLPIAVVFARFLRPRLDAQAREMRERTGQLSSAVTQTILGQRTVRSFGRERGEVLGFRSRAHELLRRALALQRTSALAGGVPRVLFGLSTAIVFAVGGLRAARGELALGELFALSMYVGMAFGPLTALADLQVRLVDVRVALERVVGFVSEERERVEPQREAARGPRVALGADVELQQVSFRHPDGQPLLDQLSLRIEAGANVALIGPSGAGKSTLVDLLLGFVQPQAGRVLLGGRDVGAIEQRALRRHIALAAHDAFLFDGTILDNVRYARPRASEAEVLEAARVCGLDRMLPGGVEALTLPVGERGQRLSAGQRQRIAIARAVLARPEVLVLDEATSSLDLAADRELRAALAQALPNTTRIWITHRTDQLDGFERVFQLERGQVLERPLDARAR
ncbi:MAG: ABC transporter ATP-binding protein [Planctomycetes bacterium]|nr:ABC transporter ATP-binding protein [Planctomycetota bacterium]